MTYRNMKKTAFCHKVQSYFDVQVTVHRDKFL